MFHCKCIYISRIYLRTTQESKKLVFLNTEISLHVSLNLKLQKIHKLICINHKKSSLKSSIIIVNDTESLISTPEQIFRKMKIDKVSSYQTNY